VSLASKLLRLGFAGWFALSQVLFCMTAAYAQSDLTDVEPPLIEHNVNESVEAAERQSFIATVVDDAELDSVSLYYRFQGDPTYNSLEMNRVSYSSTYIAHIPTDTNSARNIEYYIQARDKAGNRTVRGFAFNPLVREINGSNGSNGAVAEPNPPPASSSESEPAGKRKTILYVVLGVLAAGAVAAAMDTGGDDPPACPNDVCTVTINVGQPFNVGQP